MPYWHATIQTLLSYVNLTFFFSAFVLSGNFYDFMIKVNSQPEPSEYLPHFNCCFFRDFFFVLLQQQSNKQTQPTNINPFALLAIHGEFITNTATSKIPI